MAEDVQLLHDNHRLSCDTSMSEVSITMPLAVPLPKQVTWGWA